MIWTSSRGECHAVSLQAFGAALLTYNDAVFLQICSKQRYESGRLKRHKWALEYPRGKGGVIKRPDHPALRSPPPCPPSMINDVHFGD